MGKGIIGVDVDLTVADSDISHWEWLKSVSTKATDHFVSPSKWDYDLGKYFQMPLGVDSMDYWRLEDIYDEKPSTTPSAISWTRPVMPIRGSQRALAKLSELGWEILFISHVKGNHHKSKVEWLKRMFPFMDGFIATKEKYYANACCDIFIDDRNKHINESNADINIKFDTPYTQDEDLLRPEWVFISDSWERITNQIIDRY